MAMTPLPTPPSRGDSANFAARGDALLSALPAFVTEANALQVDVDAKQIIASSAATTATEQAGIATTKAGEAATSATSAADSKTAAAQSASDALLSKNAAAASATDAANSAATVDAQGFATEYAGASEPPVMWAYMTWADTGNMLLKRRNAAGTAWVVEGLLLEDMSIGRLLNTQVHGAPGAVSYIQTPGTKKIRVTVVGGGGGSGAVSPTSSGQVAAAGGAGYGGSAQSILDASEDLSGTAITVGVGAPESAATGNNGGTSSFGEFLSASGGVGSPIGTSDVPPRSSLGGRGGVGSGGNVFNCSGGPGSPGIALTTSLVMGGNSGGGIFGGGVIGAAVGVVTQQEGNPGVGPGCGASGGVSNSGGAGVNGTAGAPGIVIIEEFA